MSEYFTYESHYIAIGKAPTQSSVESLSPMPFAQSFSFSHSKAIEQLRQIGQDGYYDGTPRQAADIQISISQIDHTGNPFQTMNIYPRDSGEYSVNEYQPVMRHLITGKKAANCFDTYFFTLDERPTDLINLDSYEKLEKVKVLRIGDCYLNKLSWASEVGGISAYQYDLVACNYQNYDALELYNTIAELYESGSGHLYDTGMNPLYVIVTGTGAVISEVDVINTTLSGQLMTKWFGEIDVFNNDTGTKATLSGGFIGGTCTVSGLPDFGEVRAVFIEIDITRQNLHGLGSDYPFDRKIIPPANGTLRVEYQHDSMLKTDNLNALVGSHEIEITASLNYNSAIKRCFKIDNAKLIGDNFASQIGGNDTYQIEFAFEASSTGGFYEKIEIP